MSPDDARAGLASPDADTQRAALEQLAADDGPLDGPTALAVATRLAGPRKDVQRRAVDVLKTRGGAGHAAVITALRDACRGGDAVHRWGAAYALGHLDCFEPVVIGPLVEVLGDDDGDRRWAAAQLLVANGATHGSTIVTALRAALADAVPLRRKMILYVLRDLRLGTDEAVQAFVAAMEDPDVGVRMAALSGLVRFEPLPAEAGALIVTMASADPEAGARRAAVSALGKVGLDPAAVEPVLAAAEASDDVSLRRAAGMARRRR